jgi:steroid delta-isomerase-like uncharacterized protein
MTRPQQEENSDTHKARSWLLKMALTALLVTIVPIGPALAAQDVQQANKQTVRRILEEYWHNGNEAIVDELFLSNCVNHDLSNPPQRGRKAFKEWGKGISTAFATGFPDWQVVIEDLVAEGDRVSKRWVLRGTHKGEYFGVPPTGKPVTMRAVTVYHFTDGKVQEMWWNYDLFGLMQQIGGIPAPQPKKASSK